MPNEVQDEALQPEESGDEREDQATNDGEGESDLPVCILRRLDKLKELNEDRERHVAQYMKERAALEAKFNSMYERLYEERAQIVKGTTEVEENNQDSANANGDENPKGVPHFWVMVMSNNDDVSAMIAENDVDCLGYLQDIKCIDDDDGRAFTVYFYFSTNPFFENDVLSKRYEVPNLLSGDEPILKKVEGTEIKWKDDKSLTEKTVTKKQRGKGKHAGQVRSVKKTEKTESFFSWFQPPIMPSLEDMDEETAANLEVAFEMDYEVAQALRTQVVPKAVLWYTGEAGQPDLEEAVDEVIAANKS